MITLEFDDLPLWSDGVWIAGTHMIGEVDIDYDVISGHCIETIRLAADAQGKPDLVLTRVNAKPLFWDVAASINMVMEDEIKRNNPYWPKPYDENDEHRLRQHELL